jgi:hypothetical protein
MWPSRPPRLEECEIEEAPISQDHHMSVPHSGNIRHIRLADEEIVHELAALSFLKAEDCGCRGRSDAEASQNVFCDQTCENAGAPAVPDFAPRLGLDHRMDMGRQELDSASQGKRRLSENIDLIDRAVSGY